MDVSDRSSEQKGTRSFYYFITYGVCFISLGLAMASLGPILPSLAEHVDVSLAQISFLFTASSLGYLIGSAGGGRLYDHFKGHRLMLIALGLMVLMSILIPIVSVFYLLLMVMFVF
jgi:MFS transporter, FHS family, Na+ dependent glucose transporter 1